MRKRVRNYKRKIRIVGVFSCLITFEACAAQNDLSCLAPLHNIESHIILSSPLKQREILDWKELTFSLVPFTLSRLAVVPSVA